jgi:hypothetical protein
MGAEDLDERDLKGRNFSVKKNASEVELLRSQCMSHLQFIQFACLYLKSHIDVGAVDSWRPPEREPAIGNLV